MIMDNNKMNEYLDNLVKDEREFLESVDCIKNDAGVYLYKSADGNEILSLDHFLNSYKEYLIEKGLVKEC